MKMKMETTVTFGGKERVVPALDRIHLVVYRRELLGTEIGLPQFAFWNRAPRFGTREPRTALATRCPVPRRHRFPDDPFVSRNFTIWTGLSWAGGSAGFTEAVPQVAALTWRLDWSWTAQPFGAYSENRTCGVSISDGDGAMTQRG